MTEIRTDIRTDNRTGIRTDDRTDPQSSASRMEPAAQPPARAIPPEAIVRFRNLFAELLRAIDHGLESGAAEPAQATRWQRAARKLKQDSGRIDQSARQYEQGISEPLLSVSGRLRFLARDMDGYRLDFAGAETAERIESARRLVVLTAWQIHAAGHGSTASGL